MRKVLLNMKEQKKYEVIKKLSLDEMNPKEVNLSPTLLLKHDLCAHHQFYKSQ